MMIKKHKALLIVIVFLTSCSVTKKEFGQVVFDEIDDPLVAKQEILKIKSLDKNIFDSAGFVGQNLTEINYRLYKPDQKKATEKLPLVILFHGSGAIGTDNETQLGLLPKLFASPDIQKDYPAFVLAPQFSTRSADYTMDSTRNVLYSKPRPCLNSLFELIDSLKSTLNIDERRIYVVGYSMGGSSVINSLAARPDLFAAGISISGIPQFDSSKELDEIPIWLIHGTDDDENPINSDDQLFTEINSHIRYWKFTGLGHQNIMTTHILGDNLPKWLFKQVNK